MGKSKAHFIDRSKRNARNRMWGMQDRSLERVAPRKLYERIRHSASREPVLIPDPSKYAPVGEFVLDCFERQRRVAEAEKQKAAETKKQEAQAETVIDITEQKEQPQEGILVLAGVTLELDTAYSELEFSD